MNSKRIAFHHFGCKVNFAEASSLSRQFKEKGFTVIGFHQKADIYVISSCAVTATAEKKCKAAIRQAHRLNPEARIAVIGCFSELKPGELAQMEGVDLVLGHTEKFNLLAELEKPGKPEDHCNRGVTGCQPKREIFIPSYSFGDRTRSFLKIQDGCDYFCSYCTIPLARGHSRSDTLDNVLKNATEIAVNGIKEIVLTGVNIGDFGRKEGTNFFELIRLLESRIEIPRIRISSVEPDLLSNEIIDFVASSGKFLPHFHIPLQSGSNNVLKMMHRKYTRELFASRIARIRSVLPYACIAADVIVGFPGESEENFLETVEFLNPLPLSYMHVFTYSKRENTRAALLLNPVPDKIKKERSDLLHQISFRKKADFYAQNKLRRVNVLFESDDTHGFMHGFSENYITVKTRFNPGYANEIIPVILENQDSDGSYWATFYNHSLKIPEL